MMAQPTCFGSLKVEDRTNTGTVIPTLARPSQLEQTPSCTRPVAVTSSTTAQVTWMLCGCCFGEEEME